MPGQHAERGPNSRKHMSMHLMGEVRNSKRNNESLFHFQELGVRLQIPISEPIISVQISTKIEIISTAIGGTSENLSDLSLGRRPMSESEEFFEVPPLIIEI